MRDRALGVDLQKCGPEQTRPLEELGSEKGPVLRQRSLAANQLRLILPEATAIGVRLSHASGGHSVGNHRETPRTAQ